MNNITKFIIKKASLKNEVDKDVRSLNREEKREFNKAVKTKGPEYAKSLAKDILSGSINYGNLVSSDFGGLTSNLDPLSKVLMTQAALPGFSRFVMGAGDGRDNVSDLNKAMKALQNIKGSDYDKDSEFYDFLESIPSGTVAAGAAIPIVQNLEKIVNTEKFDPKTKTVTMDKRDAEFFKEIGTDLLKKIPSGASLGYLGGLLSMPAGAYLYDKYRDMQKESNEVLPGVEKGEELPEGTNLGLASAAAGGGLGYLSANPHKAPFRNKLPVESNKAKSKMEFAKAVLGKKYRTPNIGRSIYNTLAGIGGGLLATPYVNELFNDPDQLSQMAGVTKKDTIDNMVDEVYQKELEEVKNNPELYGWDPNLEGDDLRNSLEEAFENSTWQTPVDFQNSIEDELRKNYGLSPK